MIPILFRIDDTNFLTNGIGRLTDCISCLVTEERNGIYECEFQYPITGKYYHEMITNGGILSVIHDDTKDLQLFDIYAHTDPIDGVVTFNAHHVSYRLANVLLQPFTGSSVADTLERIPQNAVTHCGFTFWTDKMTVGNFNLTHPSNVRAILAGEEGSLLDVYGGGDYEFDNFAVKLYADRGFDTGVTIRYGKNLADIENAVDFSSSYSAILPYWQGTEGELVYGDIVYAPKSRAAYLPWTKETSEELEDGRGNVITFTYPIVTPVDMDFSDQFEEPPTKEQLEAAALSYMTNNKTWLPYQNITINFVQLWQTPEYESVAALQRVSLCDLVSVYFPEMGIIQEKEKVIRVVYNVLLERYDEMELGHAKYTLGDTMADLINQEVAARSTFLKEFIQTQTELITGGLGGNVVTTLNAAGQPQEILIMDTDDIDTAVNIIRLNKNGIGFSKNGYGGPYESAWTIDGKFNADFIAAGSLVADYIRGGTLTLGGFDNESGILQVLDENSDVSTTIDKTGIQTNSLTATDYIYLDAGENTNSMIRIPLGKTGGYFQNGSYFEISPSHPFLLVDHVDPNDERYFYIDRVGFKVSTNMSGRMAWMDEYGFKTLDDESDAQNVGVYLRNSDASKYFLATCLGYWTTGVKSRVIVDGQLGKNNLFCYETPTPMFGDLGEGTLDDDGVCVIDIDPVFSFGATTASYQVFLQKYGSGDCWVSERKPGYFVVEGTPGISFGWEIKAKQTDYSQVRFDDPEAIKTPESQGEALDAVYSYVIDIIERSTAA